MIESRFARGLKVDSDSSIEMRLRMALEKEMEISKNLFLLNSILVNNFNINLFLKKQGLDRVAVYGLGKVGQLFVQMLKKEGVEVVYVTDQNKDTQVQGIKTIHSTEEMSDDVDAVIVTSGFYYSEIKRSIDKEINVRVILLRDLLDYIAMEPIRVE